MANTDRITLGNFKIVAEKIKYWVTHRYPMKYEDESGETTFSIYPTKAKRDADQPSMVVTNGANGEVVAIKGALDVSETASEFELNSDGVSLDAGSAIHIDMSTSSANIQNTQEEYTNIVVGDQSVVDDGETITLNGDKIKLQGDSHNGATTASFVLDDGSVVVKDGDAESPYARLLLGKERSELVYNVNDPCAIFAGHAGKIGYIYDGTNGGTEMGTGAWHQAWSCNLTFGSWMVVYQLSTNAGASKNGQGLGGRVIVDGEEIVEGHSYVTTGTGSSTLTINGSCVVDLRKTYDSTVRKTCRIETYQNSGANQVITCNLRVMRIA